MSLQNEYLTTDAEPAAPRKNISPVPDKKVFDEVQDKKTVYDKPKTTKVDKSISNVPVYTKKKTTYSSSKTKKTSKNINGAPQVFVVNSSQVHVGAVNNYNLYTNSSGGSNCKNGKAKDTIVRSETVERVLNAKNVLVTREHINIVATHLGEGWRDVGSELGYSWGQMDHFYEDSKALGHKEVVYQMLLDWLRMKTDEATLAYLTRTLWQSGQKDVVRRLADSLQ